jgi:hypothetical protein
VDRALATKLSDAREFMISSVVEILRAYRALLYTGSQAQGEVVCPASLQPLPLLVLGLLKSTAFRTGAMPLDDRACVIFFLTFRGIVGIAPLPSPIRARLCFVANTANSFILFTDMHFYL